MTTFWGIQNPRGSYLKYPSVRKRLRYFTQVVLHLELEFHCKLCSPCNTFYKFFGCKTKSIVFEMLASEMKTYNCGYSSGNLDRTATVGVRHSRALQEVHGGGQYCVVKLTKHPAAPLGLAVRAHPQLARVTQHILLPLCLILQVHPILCKINTFSSLFT